MFILNNAYLVIKHDSYIKTYISQLIMPCITIYSCENNSCRRIDICIQGINIQLITYIIHHTFRLDPIVGAP